MALADILFRELHVDDLPEVTEVMSLCFNCHKDGLTKLLLTKIPFFREVIIASFNCEYCGFHNASIDSAGPIQDKGVKLVLKVINKNDLDRRIVLNKGSVLNIPELDSSFPNTIGSLTTVEGALLKLIDNINELQGERREVNPEVANQLDEFTEKLRNLMNLKKEFVIELLDASGNSTIESYMSTKTDPQLSIIHFNRSTEENEALGLENNENKEAPSNTYTDSAQEEFKPADEVMFVNANCPNCNVPIECRIKILDIPHFKEVIIMASTCDSCGNRENQVIGGCGIGEKSQRITLNIKEKVDLTRDLLKNDDAEICIPELELELKLSSAGSRFTTVEGILKLIADKMIEVNPFLIGDSAVKSQSENSLLNLMSELRAVANGERYGVTLIINDPTGNSYIQNLYVPDTDPRLKVEYFERTFEQNEELGLIDMEVDDY